MGDRNSWDTVLKKSGVGKWQDESGGNRDILELEIMD
jgi:hypothetical protein